MENTAIDSLGTLLADTSMRAAAEILHKRGKTAVDIDVDKLCAALRVETKAAADRILARGRALTNGGYSGWLMTLVKAECAEAAKAAVAVVLPEGVTP